MPETSERVDGLHYLICSTPRSGSSLLCGALWHTEIAGHPDDYFSRERLDEVSWAGDASSYCRRIFERGATANGVAGVKTMWLDLEGLARRIQAHAAPPRRTAYHAGNIDECFPPVRSIWTTRRDKLRQAISLARASQTQIWRVRAGAPRETGEPVFDAASIEGYRLQIETWESQWQRYFAERGIDPFRVVYEDFIANYESTVRQLIGWLGVPTPDAYPVPAPTLERLADPTTEEWVERYQHWRARPHPWHWLRARASRVRRGR